MTACFKNYIKISVQKKTMLFLRVPTILMGIWSYTTAVFCIDTLNFAVP